MFENQFVRRIFGVIFIFILSFIFSKNRKKINIKKSLIIFLTLIFLAAFLSYFKLGIYIISIIAGVFENLYKSADKGIEFLFGKLADSSLPWGFLFAVKVLPIIIFFSSVISLLYHLGVIQKFINGINFLLQPLFATNGAETLCAIANSFLGQTEAPLLIRSYLKNMNESEIFLVMVSGMGTISGGILAVYASIGVPIKHLLISSILSIPSTILISKIWYPNENKENLKVTATKDSVSYNFLDAIAKGASEGLMLALNVGAMLLVIISMLYLLDNFLDLFSVGLSYASGYEINLSVKNIFSYLALPFAYFLAVPLDEIYQVAEILGSKVAVNEMVAYVKLISMNLSSYSLIISTYALCGFSNFSCIGIQLGGIGAIEDSIRPKISKMGIRAVFAASLANILSALVVGFFI